MWLRAASANAGEFSRRIFPFRSAKRQGTVRALNRFQERNMVARTGSVQPVKGVGGSLDIPTPAMPGRWSWKTSVGWSINQTWRHEVECNLQTVVKTFT